MAKDTILSVGIDIGTSTTSMVVSRMTVANTAGCFTVPHLDITEKQIVYRSPIYTTPQLSGELLDVKALQKILQTEYERANLTPDQVDTGAVIITGESSRKENAQLVTSTLSGIAGEFVVATAGPDLESVIAAKGAGAQQLSDKESCTVANFDIGGGTSNIAIFRCGELLAKGCWDIGGRLLRFDAAGAVTYVSERLLPVAQDVGVELILGRPVDGPALCRLTDRMAALLAEAVGLLPQTPLCEIIRTGTSSPLDLSAVEHLDKVTFSGGVAAAYYDPPADLFQYGDIGPALAKSLQQAQGFSRVQVEKAKETIRATVIGAGSYTTTISGSTIDFSDEGAFPMQNLPTVLPTARQEQAACEGDSGPLLELLAWTARESDAQKLVICLTHTQNPTYRQVGLLAESILSAHRKALPGQPVLVSTRADFAKVLGQAIKRRLKGENTQVICIDGVQIEPGDYLDLGRPIAGGTAIPVVVKTLLFG
ncbi:MAG: ethanolamine ammonia-lyase reactivating factor EutA [Pygmaiobacter massiliensis]|nr:ethanolamine ammonia-lyase reactivating factor EutA [Pygmaiobacter massiliensis]